MHIASHAYTANREATSHFEGSKKELSLNTKTTTTPRNETIKKMLSESGPESVLASKGKYSHTRTFAAGPAQRAVLAFSPANKRVDGFVINKDQQLIPIKPYDLPKELQQILTSDAFEAFLNDVHTRLIPLHNGDFRLDIHQGLKGGVHRKDGNIEDVKTYLENASSKAGGGRHESRVIIKNECSYSLKLVHYHATSGSWADKQHPPSAFDKDSTIKNNEAGGILCNSTFGTPFGTKGYISVKITLEDKKNFTIICAFHTAFRGNNKATVQIRSSQNNIDSTGRVPYLDELFAECDIHPGNTIYKESEEASSEAALAVKYKFTNETKAHFYFTFTNIETDINRVNTMLTGISERNHNPKTEKKAEIPLPDQEPVNATPPKVDDQMQDNGDGSAPGVPPQAEHDRNNSNSSGYLKNIFTKANDFINDIDPEFKSAAQPLFNLASKKLFDSREETKKKEDKQSEPSE